MKAERKFEKWGSLGILPYINTGLLLVIIGINLYIIALPLFPIAWFYIQSKSPDAKLNLQSIIDSKPQNSHPASTANRLVIPAMLLDEPFFQGNDARTLNQGLWLRPQGITPDKNGNTIIAGHRFTYTNPRGNFYSLDKLKAGDDIALFWQGKKYIYTVSQIKQVPATATEIEQPSDHPQLTLYTCTPLWNPKDRLVIVAKLEKNL
jgi:LPXTG-site transpeptidase (sortase) family protein